MPVKVQDHLAVALRTPLRKSRVLACGSQLSANYSILSKVASVNNYYELQKHSSAMFRMGYFYLVQIMESTNEAYNQLSSLLMETEVL